MQRFRLLLALLAVLIMAASPAVLAAQGADAAKSGTGSAAKEADVPAPPEKPDDETAKKKTQDEAAVEVEGTISVREVITWGGAIGYFIIFLSVVTLMLIALHLINLRKARLCPISAADKIGVLLSEQRIYEAAEYTQKEGSLLSRIINAGLSRMRGGYAEMEQVMDDMAEDEALRLQQSVGYFSLIAAIAPLCGLLGTVVGMIYAFNEIATRGVVTPKELADPIQKALVTTCFGLIVAIPNVVAYTLFRNRLQQLMADLGLVIEELTMPFRSLMPGTAPEALAPRADDETSAIQEPTEEPEEPAVAEDAEAGEPPEQEEPEAAEMPEAEAEADLETPPSAQEEPAEPAETEAEALEEERTSEDEEEKQS